jgi:carbamoyl-phosphate synthase large subunit
MGRKIREFPELVKRPLPYFGVKEAVFPFNMFPEVDPILGPEMKSTGEVMGIADSFGLAFYKAQAAAGTRLPLKGNVLLTVADKDKPDVFRLAKRIKGLGFEVYTTEGTGSLLKDKGVDTRRMKKLHEGRPNIADAIMNREIHLVINTPVGQSSKYDDSYIRKTAIQYKVPYVTSMTAAEATAEGIEAMAGSEIVPKSLQEYHKELLEG